MTRDFLLTAFSIGIPILMAILSIISLAGNRQIRHLQKVNKYVKNLSFLESSNDGDDPCNSTEEIPHVTINGFSNSVINDRKESL